MSDQNSLSSLRLRSYTELTTVQLPTRAEKRLIPTLVSIGQANGVGSITVNAADFSITGAKKAFDQFVLVRIPGRGLDGQGNPDPTAAAYFQFLINPSQISITHQTLDEQAFSKGGWQIGVWGDDFVAITMNGKTPGKYFADGTTDLLSEFTVSYRNLSSLEAVFENNGYWFEGEQLNEGPLAADGLRRRIKMHQTIQLAVGEFIWEGCFESLTVTESADSPFLAEFSIAFVAWREKFRNNTPYPNSVGPSIERGHVPKIALSTGNTPQKTPSTSLNINAPSIIPQGFSNPPPSNINPLSPALGTNPPMPVLPPYVSTVEVASGGS
jgi:hypothetical protein